MSSYTYTPVVFPLLNVKARDLRFIQFDDKRIGISINRCYVGEITQASASCEYRVVWNVFYRVIGSDFFRGRLHLTVTALSYTDAVRCILEDLNTYLYSVNRNDSVEGTFLWGSRKEKVESTVAISVPDEEEV